MILNRVYIGDAEEIADKRGASRTTDDMRNVIRETENCADLEEDFGEAVAVYEGVFLLETCCVFRIIWDGADEEGLKGLLGSYGYFLWSLGGGGGAVSRGFVGPWVCSVLHRGDILGWQGGRGEAKRA